MKTLLFGLLFLGFASLGHTQTAPGTVALSDVIITPLNLAYFNTVKEKNAPEVVRKLENEAARFDITEEPVFDKKFNAYQVVFRDNENKGSIIATYDSSGKILKSYERFKNVMLPYEVRAAVYKAYPNWKIHSDTYVVSYYHNRDVKKVYKLKIKKDNKTKNLKVNPKGQML